MAAVVGSLRADLETNVAAFKTDMGQAADAVDKTSRKMKESATSASQAGKAFDSFGKMVKGALAVSAGLVIANFVKDSIKGAVASEEMHDRIVKNFGAMGDSVEGWAESTAKSLGIVDDEIKESVITFGALSQKLVPTQGEAAKMSETMAQLAVDVASFNRIPVAEATDKLRAALTGSTKGLKEFGILITDQEVKQKALDMGLASSTDKISAQDKALATYNLILEKTGNLQGFAATQTNTTAGKLRAFQAQIDSLSDTLGATLLPILTEVVKWLGLYADGIKTILGDTADFELGLQVLGAKMTGGNVNEVVKAWREAHGISTEAAQAAKTNGGVIETEFEGMGLTAAEVGQRMRAATDQVFAMQRAVREFGINDLPVSTRLMSDYGDSFSDLSRSIQNAIDTIKEKADATQDEKNAVVILQEQLDKLGQKYDDAAAAAESLFLATTQAAVLQSKVGVGAINEQTDSLRQAGGGLGVMTDSQQRLLDLEKKLQAERLKGVADLAELDRQIAAAQLANDDQELARLDELALAQMDYNALLDQTTAKQIYGQQQLQAMVDQFASITSGTFADLFKGLRDAGTEFDFKSWAADFLRNMSDAVLDRKADQLTQGLFDLLGIGQKTQEVDTINAKALNIMSTGGALTGMGLPFGGTPGLPGAPGAGGGGGGLGGFFSSAWQGISSFFGGFFADGGSLMPGDWGIAGENGPELLRGGMHGMQVEPMTGAGGDMTQVFNITTPNPDGFRASTRQISQLAKRQLGAT